MPRPQPLLLPLSRVAHNHKQHCQPPLTGCRPPPSTFLVTLQVRPQDSFRLRAQAASSRETHSTCQSIHLVEAPGMAWIRHRPVAASLRPALLRLVADGHL